jgi:hypothetical protein
MRTRGQAILMEWKTLSEFEDLLIQIADAMEGKLLRRVCRGWFHMVADEQV